MVTHMVLFKLVDPSPERLAATCAVLAAMPDHIPQLRYIELGVDSLRQEGSYDLALLTRFDGWEDFHAYRTHPYHVEVVNAHLRDVLAGRAVVDWETAS
jgi:hypothetical protein